MNSRVNHDINIGIETEMPKLEIVTAPNFLLQKATKACTDVGSERLKNLVSDMFDVMYTNAGIGLAAPQLGISEKVIVIDVQNQKTLAKNAENCFNTGTFVLVNPNIVSSSSEMISSIEGCLSLPNIFETIQRHKTITVNFYDLNGEFQTITATDLLSICIQHEVNHLDGILFIDHLSRLKRKMILKKLEKSVLNY